MLDGDVELSSTVSALHEATRDAGEGSELATTPGTRNVNQPIDSSRCHLHPPGTCLVWADDARRALINGVAEIDDLATKLVHRPVPPGFPDRCGVVLRYAPYPMNGVRHYVLRTHPPHVLAWTANR